MIISLLPGIYEDITERIQGDQAKHALEKSLARARKMEAIGQLAGGVAHDLNNILSGLIGYPELILMDLPKESHLKGLVETYRKILEIHPEQNAVITSGYSQSERVKEALRLGAGAFLRKPYSLIKLGLTVKRQLQTARETMALPMTG